MVAERLDKRSIESLHLSNKPRVQLRAPEIGGMLELMGERSSTRSTRTFPSWKICCVSFRSYLNSSRKGDVLAFKLILDDGPVEEAFEGI
jgi:hypothetical protein